MKNSNIPTACAETGLVLPGTQTGHVKKKKKKKKDLFYSNPSVFLHEHDTFHEQGDGSCCAAHFTAGHTDVNTGVGRRGSCDRDALLAPPSGGHRIACRGVFPVDLRGRVPLSRTLKGNVPSRGKLLGVIIQVKNGAVCGSDV